ncbi:MAG: hypothetical protein M5R41_18295 [Bacteroidia bacterium]|nr:hypothetical protein [Bacteroidia bacterium]
MKRLKELSTRRVREHDYSEPGKHLIVFKTKGEAEILGSTENGITTLSDAGRVFLDVLGQALQNFPCIRIHGLTIRPSEVELALEITDIRMLREMPPEDSDEWVYFRRVMTLPMFMGYLKMNSAHRINTLFGKGGGEVWARRYATCILNDEVVFDRVCAELEEEWSRVVVAVTPRTKKEKRVFSFDDVLAKEFGGAGAAGVRRSSRRGKSSQLGEAMFLGRVLLLTGARRDAAVNTSTQKGVTRGGGSGGKARVRNTVIRDVGPDRIFLSE